MINLAMVFVWNRYRRYLKFDHKKKDDQVSMYGEPISLPSLIIETSLSHFRFIALSLSNAMIRPDKSFVSTLALLISTVYPMSRVLPSISFVEKIL